MIDVWCFGSTLRRLKIGANPREGKAAVIEPTSPAYRQVVDELRRRVRVGQYQPGSALPAEPELAEEFGVSRSLVNRALSVLRTEGWVRPERGRGTTVNPLPVLRRSTIARQGRAAREAGAARGAFAAEVAAAGFSPRSNSAVREIPAPDDIAAELGIEPGAPAIERRRVMYADNIPVQVAVSWLPASIAAGTPIAQQDPGPGGIYSRLADIGHAPARFRELTRVRTPDDGEARALHLDGDHRVYEITRTARDADGLVVEVNRIVLAAHQWELETEWVAEN